MLLLLWGNVASLLHETAPVVPETVVQSQSGLFKNRIFKKILKIMGLKYDYKDNYNYSFSSSSGSSTHGCGFSHSNGVNLKMINVVGKPNRTNSAVF